MRLVALLALLGGARSWSCSSDAACQLNGICVAGRCQCDPQWSGANCSSLNLGRSFVAYSGMAARTSTWGGRAVYDPMNRIWHGYFAEMSNHCTLSAWTTNSMTVHATSPNLTGPYQYSDTVQAAWSHNPAVSQDPVSGEVLIAHIGCGHIPAGAHALNCTGGRPHRLARQPVPEQAGAPCGCPVPHQGVPCQTLQVLRSRSFLGPWTDITIAQPLQNASLWPSSLSNPSLLVEPYGVLLGFNGNLAPPMNHGETSHAGLMISRSGTVDGPFDLVNVSTDPVTGVTRHYLDGPSPGAGGRCEDENLYRDHRGHLHLISHCFYDKFPGGHGWTADPTGASGWEFSQTAAYTFDARLDGQPVQLAQRERPQVVLQDGVLSHLFNGARGPKGNPNPEGLTFSMVTEICANGPAVDGACP